MRKIVLFGACAAMAMGLASTAAADSVLITADQLTSYDYTTVLGGSVDGNPYSPLDVYESPELFTASVNGGPSQTLLAFCVDVFHFSPSSLPANYVTSPVQSNSDSSQSGGGPALTPVVSGEIGYLANLGKTTSNTASLAGIQGAIWEIEYPGLTLTGNSTVVASDVTSFVGLANAWAAVHAGSASDASGIYPTNGETQGFGFTQGFATGGVPEPATWAMMLVGFGGLGLAMRSRRRLATAA